jgi:hypothetical protein
MPLQAVLAPAQHRRSDPSRVYSSKLSVSVRPLYSTTVEGKVTGARLRRAERFFKDGPKWGHNVRALLDYQDYFWCLYSLANHVGLRFRSSWHV